MQAVILAAGMGKRLKELFQIYILEHQLCL